MNIPLEWVIVKQETKQKRTETKRNETKRVTTDTKHV
jgi:hypothetical protein